MPSKSPEPRESAPPMDPLQARMAQAARAREQQAREQQAREHSLPADAAPDLPPTDPPSSTTNESTANGPLSLSTSMLASYGQHIKSKRTLSPEAQAELDAFSKTIAGSPAPQLVMIFWMLLLIWDLLCKQMRADVFTILEDLKENIKTYSFAFILSPVINRYRGKAPEVVLAVMRELNVREIPNDSEPAQVAQVLTVISDQLTRARNHLKDKITKSLEFESPIRNIADLTAAAIGTRRLQPTLQLYLRLAFLRYNIVTYPTLEDDKFWNHMDTKLLAMCEAGNPEDTLSTFNGIYDDDISTYGNPTESDCEVTREADTQMLQLVVNRHASTLKSSSGTRKKRPHFKA